ncbi:MAG: alpha/beta fold hydrolase [Burkholderiaceae bacterium]
MQLPDHSISHPRVAANGTTVVLLHGAYGAKEYWRGQVRALVDHGYRVVAWDAPGYGQSRLPDDFSIARCADALAALLAQAGGRRNVLLGHSMGGMIALQAWTRARGSIHGYVLSATGAAFGRPDGEWQKEFVRQRVAPLDAGETLAGYAPRMLRSMMGPAAAGAGVDLVIDTVRQMDEATFRAAIQAITRFDAREWLPSIDVPVLCLPGELDTTAPAEGMRRMAQKLPRAEFHAMPAVGHFAWAEQPDAFNSIVLDFLARHGFGKPMSQS